MLTNILIIYLIGCIIQLVLWYITPDLDTDSLLVDGIFIFGSWVTFAGVMYYFFKLPWEKDDD